jgi:hypothetical protein
MAHQKAHFQKRIMAKSENLWLTEDAVVKFLTAQ